MVDLPGGGHVPVSYQSHHLQDPNLREDSWNDLGESSRDADIHDFFLESSRMHKTIVVQHHQLMPMITKPNQAYPSFH